MEQSETAYPIYRMLATCLGALTRAQTSRVHIFDVVRSAC
jgi:hypothetical protein